MIQNSLLPLFITMFLCVIWLRLNDYLAHKGWISGPLSRKIIHIGTGPIFVLCWLLFPNVPSSRYLAALVPLMITVQFFLIGMGVIKDQASVDAMSRHGDRREILRGPFYYGIVFVLLTVLFWYDSPIGIVALMSLCGGDGLADVLGKRINSSRLPWSKGKSIAGSISMFAGSLIFSVIILWIYIAAGKFSGNLTDYLPAVAIISLASTVIESLPFSDVDNLLVPLVDVLLGFLFF